MLMQAVSTFVDFYSWGILIYFFLVNFLYIFLIFSSLGRLKKSVKIVKNDITAIGEYTKPISILVPAYNEQETVIANIQSLLELEYPLFEVVLINDGSTDETLKRVIEHFNLRYIEEEINEEIPCNEIKAVYSSFELSNLIVVDKVNGGKSDALNAGVNISRYPLFCAIDADCIIEKDALLRIVKPFLKYDDMIAVGGFVRIANGCTIKKGKLIEAKLPSKLVENFQIIEYFRAFLTSRVGWENLNSLLIISGAFGLFKKSAVIAVGGYKKTIGEDMELTLNMHEHFRNKKIPYKINFASDAVCWTQAPDTLRDLRGQRIRWHRGLMDSLGNHKKMMFNPRYGTVGLFSLPYFFLVELLGPVVETFGYALLIVSIITGMLSPFFLAIFAMAYLFGILFSLTAILFEELSYNRYKGKREMLSLIGVSFLEQLSYRQITIFWRFLAFFNYKKGSKTWGKIKRKSFHKEEASRED